MLIMLINIKKKTNIGFLVLTLHCLQWKTLKNSLTVLR